MILKGNQRGGGSQLAAHLMNSFDNERIEIADVRGATAQDLSGAFAEWATEARATKAKKNLYSFSASPDQSQGRLTRAQYLELIDRTERSLKLVGQPRAIVFHEKRDERGVLREHCHVVWSRIDTEKMKAVQISHDRLKLRTVAREFARDHGLELPAGMKKDGKRNRFNDRAKQENLAERQQKERNGISKEQRMADIATCWKETGNGAAFVQALESKGYYLARGDKRAFVVVDLHGEVHSLSKQLSGVAKSKDLKDRLAGYPVDKLFDVKAAQAWAKKQREEAAKKQETEQEKRQEPSRGEAADGLAKRLQALHERQQQRRAALDQRRFDLLARHLSERGGLKAMQEADNTGVVSARLQRQPKGLMAFLTRITGIKMIVDARQRREDERRAAQHNEQQAALQHRQDRELTEIERRSGALDRIEERENRSAQTALHREEFQRVRARVIEMPRDRKPPERELKPEFDRAAQQVLQRTGTDDGRAPQGATGAKQDDASQHEKGKLVRLFNHMVEGLHPEPPKPTPAPVAAKPEFEKAAKPPIDLTEAFNREVENRMSREERERDPDGPGRSFDPRDRKR
jgi:hypothetical protein